MKKVTKSKSKLILLLFLSIVFTTHLDIVKANPILTDMAVTNYFEEGGTIHNGTDIHMPEACAQIDYNHSYNDYLSIVCNFSICTNTTQNATLAFVQPILQTLWSDTIQGFNFTMHISVNSITTNYTTCTWQQLGWNASDYLELDQNGSWLTDADYSIFDVNLIANSTTNIIVSLVAWGFGWCNSLDFRYVVGSARTFDSDTHQKIQIKATEFVSMVEMNFYPEDCLSLEKQGITTYATWEFMVNDFAYDAISAEFYLNRKTFVFPPTTNTTTTNSSVDLILFGITSSIAVGTALVLIIFLIKRKNPI